MEDCGVFFGILDFKSFPLLGMFDLQVVVNDQVPISPTLLACGVLHRQGLLLLKHSLDGSG